MEVIAVDTNILLYTCDARDARKQNAAQVLVRGLQEPVLLWQVACEFIAASRKLVETGFTQAAAWDRLRDFAAFWHSTLYAARLYAGVTRLCSEDIPGSAIPGLEVVDPFA